MGLVACGGESEGEVGRETRGRQVGRETRGHQVGEGEYEGGRC